MITLRLHCNLTVLLGAMSSADHRCDETSPLDEFSDRRGERQRSDEVVQVIQCALWLILGSNEAAETFADRLGSVVAFRGGATTATKERFWTRDGRDRIRFGDVFISNRSLGAMPRDDDACSPAHHRMAIRDFGR